MKLQDYDSIVIIKNQNIKCRRKCLIKQQCNTAQNSDTRYDICHAPAPFHSIVVYLLILNAVCNSELIKLCIDSFTEHLIMLHNQHCWLKFDNQVFKLFS